MNKERLSHSIAKEKGFFDSPFWLKIRSFFIGSTENNNPENVNNGGDSSQQINPFITFIPDLTSEEAPLLDQDDKGVYYSEVSPPNFNPSKQEKINNGHRSKSKRYQNSQRAGQEARDIQSKLNRFMTEFNASQRS